MAQTFHIKKIKDIQNVTRQITDTNVVNKKKKKKLKRIHNLSDDNNLYVTFIRTPAHFSKDYKKQCKYSFYLSCNCSTDFIISEDNNQ